MSRPEEETPEEETPGPEPTPEPTPEPIPEPTPEPIPEPEETPTPTRDPREPPFELTSPESTSQLPPMTHPKAIEKAIVELMKFQDTFVRHMADELLALYKSTPINPHKRLVDIPFSQMTTDESKEFLQFQTYIYSTLNVIFNSYAEKIKTTDIETHEKLKTAEK